MFGLLLALLVLDGILLGVVVLLQSGKGGGLSFQCGRDQNGFEPPSLKVKADGTFWIGDKEVEGDSEEFSTAFAEFAVMMNSQWHRDVNRTVDMAKRIAELEIENGRLRQKFEQ